MMQCPPSSSKGSNVLLVRELAKKMYRGQFSYFTGPKSHYPDKLINASLPPILIDQLNQDMAKLSMEDKQDLQKFASSYGRRVRQHTVHEKSKEMTGCLPYTVSFCEEACEQGSPISMSSVAISENRGERLNRQPEYEVLFSEGEVVAIRDARKRETFIFFIAILMNYLLVKKNTGNTELVFAENAVDILWLDNNSTDDSLSYSEAYRDRKNSPYTIVDRVEIAVEEGTSGEKAYILPEEEADRIERRLQGGDDGDADSEDEESDANDDDIGTVIYRTRIGRSGTRLIL